MVVAVNVLFLTSSAHAFSLITAVDKHRSSKKKNNYYYAALDDNTDAVDAESTHAAGLYKIFADHALQKLIETEWLEEDGSVPTDLSRKQVPARKGSNNNSGSSSSNDNGESIVRITTKVLIPKTKTKTTTNMINDGNISNIDKSLIRYARITLLETVPITLSKKSFNNNDNNKESSTTGIQVLNFIILPNSDTTLPVLGIDLVSLPGSKHLLLLDAQPMTDPNPHERYWDDWYKTHVVAAAATAEQQEKEDDEKQIESSSSSSSTTLKFAWGGDFPTEVKRYVSRNALWTRLQNVDQLLGQNNNDNNNEDEDDTANGSIHEAATTTMTKRKNDEKKNNDTVNSTTSNSSRVVTDIIQEDIFLAFQDHLDAYLELLDDTMKQDKNVQGDNYQLSYLDYRRNNDPAKPMLNSLYGKEWTQSLLDNVLFPQN